MLLFLCSPVFQKENLENDPRLPRTIFVGNVPSLLKPAKLTSFIEKHLGVDSSTQQSIVESVRYRSVAISDPKLPKKVAIQKGLLHEARDSLNAYVVFTHEKPWVARAIAELNGKDIELDEKSWRLRFDTVTSGGADAAVAGEVVPDGLQAVLRDGERNAAHDAGDAIAALGEVRDGGVFLRRVVDALRVGGGAVRSVHR